MNMKCMGDRIEIENSPLLNSTQNDILQALVALGYSDKEAALSLKSLPAGVSVSEGIKFALKALAR
jgi:Holliday junction DNA helicase RuvA